MLKPAAAFLFLAIAVLPSFAEANCPAINGRYRFVYKKEGDRHLFHEVYMLTRQDRAGFSYLWDRDTYQIADGKFYPVRIGEKEAELRHTCEDGTLLQELRAKGSEKIWWSRYKVLNRMEIEVSGNYPGQSGIYQKQL